MAGDRDKEPASVHIGSRRGASVAGKGNVKVNVKGVMAKVKEIGKENRKVNEKVLGRNT